jgi:hypothetical protein
VTPTAVSIYLHSMPPLKHCANHYKIRTDPRNKKQWYPCFTSSKSVCFRLHSHVRSVPSRSIQHFPPLGKFLLDILLRECHSLCPQHIRQLFLRHLNLLAHRYQAIGEMVIVLHQQSECDLQVVDVVERKCTTGGVLALCLEKRVGMIAPMTAGVEVVRGVVAIVEAITVALCRVSAPDSATLPRGDLQAHQSG